MDIDEQTTIDVPLDRAWPSVQDPEVVASCLPGAHLEEGPNEDGEYQGRLDVRFGPTRASFAGRVSLETDDAAHSIQIRGRGQDRRGMNRASVDVTVGLEDADARATRLRVAGTINIVGPLERFAATGGAHLAGELMEQFAHNLANHVRDADGHEPEQPAEDASSHDTDASQQGDTTRPRPKRGDASSISGGRMLWRAFKRSIQRDRRS